jgi:hypothetical protein
MDPGGNGTADAGISCGDRSAVVVGGLQEIAPRVVPSPVTALFPPDGEPDDPPHADTATTTMSVASAMVERAVC